MIRSLEGQVSTRGASERALAHLRGLIDSGALEPGSRLPSERQLARTIGVARPTLRVAIRTLSRLGLLESVRGVGSFVVCRPLAGGPSPAITLASMLALSDPALLEIRTVVEPGGAALAAARATLDECAAIADEVANLYAAISDPALFFLHEVRFHRTVCAASGNPLIISVVDLLTEACYERFRQRSPLAATDGLRESATAHRRIYHAIRDHDAARARAEMAADLARPWPGWPRPMLLSEQRAWRL